MLLCLLLLLLLPRLLHYILAINCSEEVERRLQINGIAPRPRFRSCRHGCASSLLATLSHSGRLCPGRQPSPLKQTHTAASWLPTARSAAGRGSLLQEAGSLTYVHGTLACEGKRGCML